MIARTSPFSLYSEDLATFSKDDVYDQADATGFINLFGLPVAVAGARKRSVGSLPKVGTSTQAIGSPVG